MVLRFSLVSLFLLFSTAIVLESHATTKGAPEVINGKVMDEQLMPAVFRLPMGCTGTWLNSRMFITSAHCTVHGPGRAGRRRVDIGGQRAKLYNHPDYNTKNFRNGTYRDYFDVSVGVFKKDVITDNRKFATLCEHQMNTKGKLVDESLVLGRRALLVGYGCNTWPNRTGTGVKRYGYSTITEVDRDYFTSLDPKGGLSCPGDSGGPYFMVNDDQTGCIAAINFYSDRKQQNHATNIFHPKVQSFLRKVADDNNLDVCGINTSCTDLEIPAKIQE